MLKFTIKERVEKDYGRISSVGMGRGRQGGHLFEVLWECDSEAWSVRGDASGVAISKQAASHLHALELGLTAAARWLAVELLKDPAPPTRDETVAGIALWLDGTSRRTALTTTLWLRGLGEPGHIGQVMADAPLATVGEFRARWLMSDSDLDSHCMRCASEEQALAVLIEHAAPWIAAALVKEVAP